MNLNHFTDGSFFNKALCGDVRGIPGQGPVNREQFTGTPHRLYHQVCVRQAGGEGFFEKNVRAKGRDLQDPLGMPGRGRTEKDNIRFCALQTDPVIREHALWKNGEVPNGRLHFTWILVADAHNFRIGMVKDHPQVIAHVIMVEVDSCNLPFAHWFVDPGGFLPPDSRKRLLYDQRPEICYRLLRSVLR